MSWNVATQNGVSVSLASIVSLSCGATEFSPASLFTSGVAGAWYDPSDYSTLFQDSAGTTPVTAVEQPVGLMLDKSQGLALTPTAIDGNLNTATWTKGTGWSAPSARSLVCDGTQTGSSDTSASYTKPTGALVRWSFTISAISGTLTVYPTGGAPSTFTTTGAKTVCSDAASNFNIFRIGAGQTCTITDIRIEIIAGNHASQATAASRPVLRARYNLLTYSEQFDNAFWIKSGATVSANVTTAPDGTSTADLVTVTAQFGGVTNTYTGLIIGAQYTYSFYAKSNTGTNALVLRNDTAGTNIGTYTPTSDWVRYSFTFTATGTSAQLWPLQDRNASGFGSTYLWGAQLVTGSSAGTYQRIAAATDYATAGFLPYLSGDGVDDQMSSNSINLTGTDKLTAVFGSLSNATTNQGVFQFGSGGAGTMNALYLIGAPSDMRSSLQGSTGTSQMRVTGTGVSTASVYSQLYDIAGATAADESQIRVNGTLPTQTVQSAGPAGGGNFANTTLTIFQYASAFFLNGRIYQLVFCGKTLSASELASTEAYVNSKTGAY